MNNWRLLISEGKMLKACKKRKTGKEVGKSGKDAGK